MAAMNLNRRHANNGMILTEIVNGPRYLNMQVAEWWKRALSLRITGLCCFFPRCPRAVNLNSAATCHVESLFESLEWAARTNKREREEKKRAMLEAE